MQKQRTLKRNKLQEDIGPQKKSKKLVLCVAPNGEFHYWKECYIVHKSDADEFSNIKFDDDFPPSDEALIKVGSAGKTNLKLMDAIKNPNDYVVIMPFFDNTPTSDPIPLNSVKLYLVDSNKIDEYDFGLDDITDRNLRKIISDPSTKRYSFKQFYQQLPELKKFQMVEAPEFNSTKTSKTQNIESLSEKKVICVFSDKETWDLWNNCYFGYVEDQDPNNEDEIDRNQLFRVKYIKPELSKLDNIIIVLSDKETWDKPENVILHIIDSDQDPDEYIQSLRKNSTPRITFSIENFYKRERELKKKYILEGSSPMDPTKPLKKRKSLKGIGVDTDDSVDDSSEDVAGSNEREIQSLSFKVLGAIENGEDLSTVQGLKARHRFALDSKYDVLSDMLVRNQDKRARQIVSTVLEY